MAVTLNHKGLRPIRRLICCLDEKRYCGSPSQPDTATVHPKQRPLKKKKRLHYRRGMVSSKTNADLCFRKSPCVAQGRIMAEGIKWEKMDIYP